MSPHLRCSSAYLRCSSAIRACSAANRCRSASSASALRFSSSKRRCSSSKRRCSSVHNGILITDLRTERMNASVARTSDARLFSSNAGFLCLFTLCCFRCQSQPLLLSSQCGRLSRLLLQLTLPLNRFQLSCQVKELSESHQPNSTEGQRESPFLRCSSASRTCSSANRACSSACRSASAAAARSASSLALRSASSRCRASSLARASSPTRSCARFCCHQIRWPKARIQGKRAASQRVSKSASQRVSE